MVADSDDIARMAALFGQVAWFATLPESARGELAAGSSWQRIAGGDVLFVEGEGSDAVYLLVHGALAAFRREADGSSRMIGQIMAGETVGELGVLVSRPRSATIRALRDSVLVRLPAAHLESVSQRHPEAMLGLARLALRRRGELQPHDPTPRSLAILARSRGVDVRAFADAFSRALGAFGSVRVLDHRDAGTDAETCHAIEAASRFVLYVGDGDDGGWHDRCARQADALLFLRRADDDETPQPIAPDPVARARHLLLLHHGDLRIGAGARARALEPTAMLHHLRDDADLARLARLLVGRSLALVLSGGGARGFAHIGAVKALREAGFAIDAVAGTSIGAVIGAAVAAEWSIEEMTEHFRRIFYDRNPLSDLTLPLVSLVTGRRMSQLLRDTFGERDIEDLPLPYFCLSANLTRGEAHAHRNGRIWQALRASAAIPGLIPPVFRQGEVFVDGGVVNNLPVDLMRQRHRGEVIAVDVGADYALRTTVDEYELPPLWRLWLEGRRGHRRPSLREILLRAGMVNSGAHTLAARAQCSWLIQPPLADIGLLEWEHFYRAIDRGYQHTLRLVGGPRDALAEDLPVF